MAKQVNVLAAKVDDLGLIPGTYMLKRQNGLPKLSSDLYLCTHTNTYTYKQINVKEIRKETKNILCSI